VAKTTEEQDYHESMNPLGVTVAEPNCLPEFAKQIIAETAIAS